MNETPTRPPAAERLLDAALVQLFAAPAARAPTVPRLPWLLAAMLLLGGAVVATIMWQVRAPQRDEAQDPVSPPLSDEVTGDGKAGIEALPTTTDNLLAKLVDPRDLSVVTRFEGLRVLRLWPEKTSILGISTGYHGAWSEPPTDLLQPLAQLERLEVLRLPAKLMVSPELLGPLAGHPCLREIQFVRDGCTFDDDLVAALARIPHLAALDLQFVPMPAAALRALTGLALTSLTLDCCEGLDADGWQHLLAMRSLRRLAFRNWNGNLLAAGQPWHPAPADFRRLQEMPRLRHLELQHCGIDDERFAALPDTLTTLHLLGTKVTPAGFDALRRFLVLRELAITANSYRGTIPSMADLLGPDSEPHADAFAAALQPLRLRTLRYSGALTPAVAQAIGAQRDLRELQITSKEPAAPTTAFAALRLHRLVWRAPVTAELMQAIARQTDLLELELHAAAIPPLQSLAELPRLETLRLVQMGIGNGIPAASLAPLARSPSLRMVDVTVYVKRAEARPSETELQRAVGERIRLRLRESEFTVKR